MAPIVGGKHYSYDKKGRAAAKRAKAGAKKKIGNRKRYGKK